MLQSQSTRYALSSRLHPNRFSHTLRSVSQHEAASASVKLQRHSLDTSRALERSQALEKENARLIEEINVLRAYPNANPDPSAFQNPQLNNTLRQLSDKLSQTEELLLKRTSESLHATHELAMAEYDRDVAYGIASRARAREEDCKVRERDLLLQARNAKEESKMADLVVQVSSATPCAGGLCVHHRGTGIRQPCPKPDG